MSNPVITPEKRRLVANSRTLEALFSAGGADDYRTQVKENWTVLRTDLIGIEPDVEFFPIPGYCLPCEKQVEFRVDYLAGGSRSTGPNWRERLLCPNCKLSNRQRVIATLVSQVLADVSSGKQIYLMEQATPLMNFLDKKQSRHEVIGSEYFGAQFKPGQTIWPWHYLAPGDRGRPIRSILLAARLAVRMFRRCGFRHENIEQLSFVDASLDFIVSNDVFEHVADPVGAFRECARVLKPGGVMFATFPFFSDMGKSATRARLGPGGVEHLLPAEYHGDPTSSSGALVFTDFGGDVFGMLCEAGFSRVQIEVFHDLELGHLGGVPVFIVTR
jgi:SAM-dependent methyltransferase